MIPFVDDQSRPVPLGTEIARGGEGVVYEIPSDPSVVAKIYLKPLDGEKVSKLSAMARIATPDILKFAAWPRSVLRRNGNVIGLLMPRVPAPSRPIHDLYTPKTRLREFPSANWQFLVNVAANVSRGFAVIHRNGHIVGDVNHGNVLVGPDGIASFIDCDSFQVQSNGHTYLCDVGVSTYTPPELQNKSFDQVIRTQNHDCFGLAVLLFHLLFMGRHPFAGRYEGPGYMPIERAIGESRFAFGRLARQMLMSPPPASLLLSQIPSALADAFERSFSADAARGSNRPTAMEWVSLLERFQRELTRCKSNQAHVYFSQLGSCPWCSIEAHGIVLFIDLRVDITPGLNVDILWKKLSSLPPLEALAPIPTNANWNASVFPTTDARLLGRTRKVRLGIGIATVVVSVCFVVALNINGPVALILIGLAVAFAYKFPQRFQQKRDATAKVVRDCQKRYQELQMRYASECSEEIFCKKTKELGALRAQYNQLPLLRQQMIQELEKRKFQLQLHDFLDRINISDATIRLIGPGRKAMLVSFGIDSAADVSYASVTQVPGIGPKYANNLLDWRRSMEARFQFDPNKAIAKNETDKIDSEIHSRRSELQTTLSRGIQDAAASHSRILAVRASYQEQLKAAYKVFMQEQANLSVS